MGSTTEHNLKVLLKPYTLIMHRQLSIDKSHHGCYSWNSQLHK